MSSLVLGVINIAITIAVLILVGLLVVWFTSMMKMPVPEQVKNIYLIIVGLIGLYMLVALVFGLPSFSVMNRW